MKNKHTVRAHIAALSILFSSYSFAGGGGGMTGGATEITQILNNGELMMQVSESITQTMTQMNQLAQMQQMLTNLPQTVLREMGVSPEVAGNIASTVQKVSQAYRTVSSLNGNLQSFGSQLQNINRLANLNGMQTSSFVSGELARFGATGRGLDMESGLERQTFDNIVGDYEAADRIMQQIPQTQGMRDTTQLMTSSVARLIRSVGNVGMLASSSQRLQLDKSKVELDREIGSKLDLDKFFQDRDKARGQPSDFNVPWKGR